MKCNLPVEKDELNYLIATIARSINKDTSCAIKGLGKIVKKHEEYIFIPEKKLQQLLDTADKYPEPVMPLSKEAKDLYGIDTIGDGGLHIFGNGFSVLYYKIEDRKLKLVDDEEINDKEFDFSGPVSFDQKSAGHFPLVCLDNKWSMKNAVFQNETDREYMNTVLIGTKYNADMFLKYALKEMYDGLIEDEDEVFFVKKMECSFDKASGIIRISMLWEMADRW